MSQKIYSLRKSRKILETSYDWYKLKGQTLDSASLAQFESLLQLCDEACLQKNRKEAHDHALALEELTSKHFQKTPFHYFKELSLALIMALVIAIVFRAMWFEPYEIPTGSMRPTFKEQDHLTVSKIQFGINVPLKTAHFYFDPHLVERTGIVIWSGDGVALRETDTTYFGIFPYKKRYIKRLIGKPGDRLYFYGGKIYGIDKEEQPIKEFLDSPWMANLDHIPFLTFEGEIVEPVHGTLQFEQMHQPIGRLAVNHKGKLTGEVYDGKDWVQDQPSSQRLAHPRIQAYSDFMGMRNFAMARLLTKQELKQFKDRDVSNLEEGVLYLELIHHPSLTYPKPFMRQEYSSHNALSPLVSVIPLKEEHLKKILDHMYTARFEVENGVAKRYSLGENTNHVTNPLFPGIPNGTYEFYYGQAVKIGWGGITTILAPEHPLYKLTAANVQNLFNYGIDFSTFYAPKPTNFFLYPHRYAYFRKGDLYLLGAPILKKEDPTLQKFLANEMRKEQQSTDNKPYTAFKDYGPPIKEGVYDTAFIKAFGIEVPAKHYLVLGDNHAMSADSRIFGFLPEANLQGVPELILWPPGDRLGKPAQVPYPLLTVPRLIIWGLFLLGLSLWYGFQYYHSKKRVFKKIEFNKEN